MISTDSEKDNALIGGLRNAVERGETLEDATQSFINAGYSEAEVSEASHQIDRVASQIPMQNNESSNTIPSGIDNVRVPKIVANPLPNNFVSNVPKKSSKKLMIILGIVAVIILAVAAFLGIYWNYWNKFF